MADARKYRDDEIKEIFELATSGAAAGRSAVSDQAGLTLAELQEVGLEVGVEPGRIAAAALALEARRDVVLRKTSLGMPIAVSRVIELPGTVTDSEWEQLVVELREISGARGQLVSHGGVREWSDGSLHASLEPTETGDRLRLMAHRGGALALNRMGSAGLAVGTILLTMFLAAGPSPVGLEIVMMLLVGMGGGALVSNMISLPRWAREREGQMEYLAGRIQVLLGRPPQEEESVT